MPAGYRKVYQYDSEGNWIKEYENIREAEHISLINNIHAVLNGKKNMCSAGGYIWSYDYYAKLPKQILVKYEDRLFEKYNVPIFEYDMNGNLLNEYSSLSQITKNRTERNCIRSVLKGECKSSKNKIYSFKKIPKTFFKKYFQIWKGFVLQFDLNGNLIKEWKSSYEASKILKISRTNIDRCLKKERKISNGFIWKYKN
jgi:hypothetical protein